MTAALEHGELDGRVFEAQWYAKGVEPGASVRGPWATLTACGVDPATIATFYDFAWTEGSTATTPGAVGIPVAVRPRIE